MACLARESSPRVFLVTGSRRTYTGTKLETADTAKGSLRSLAPVLDPTENGQGARPADPAVTSTEGGRGHPVGARSVCAQTVPNSGVLRRIPAHSSAWGRREPRVPHQIVTRTYTDRGIGPKILVWAVQSRPCPPFFHLVARIKVFSKVTLCPSLCPTRAHSRAFQRTKTTEPITSDRGKPVGLT